jgi:hypothetical protein
MMRSRNPEEALSEVIGFILLLALVVAALAIYQIYAVPSQGRDDEINHMNDVRDRFTDYTFILDALWLNDREGVSLGMAYPMGTRGMTAQAGFLQVMQPIGSTGSLSVDENYGAFTLTASGLAGSISFPLGALTYQSDNNYWVQQTYYSQGGGVFLKQEEGVVNLIPPAVSVFNVNNSYAQVNVTPVRLYGSGIISGASPVLVETRMKSSPPYNTGGTRHEWVTITITTASINEAYAWEKIFKNAALREGLPQSWYTTGYSGTSTSGTAYLTVIGPDIGIATDVELGLTRADFQVSIQNVASLIG